MKSIAWRWLVVGLAGNLLLEVLDGWRAHLFEGDPPSWLWVLLVGSGPNAAAVLAIGGTLMGVLGSEARWRRLVHGPDRAAWVASGVPALGLSLWEVVQPLTAHGVFDWTDIAATWATALVVWGVARRHPTLGAGDAPRVADGSLIT